MNSASRPHTFLPQETLEAYRIEGQKLVLASDNADLQNLGHIICQLSADIEELRIELDTLKSLYEALLRSEKLRRTSLTIP